MIHLKMIDGHSNGTHALEILTHNDGDVSLTVWDMSGGPQFDFDLDDSDLEILQLILTRAKNMRQDALEENT